MAGQYTSNQSLDADEPPLADPEAGQPAYAGSRADDPGLLPPPLSYPNRNRRRLVIGILAAVALIAGMTAAIVGGLRQSQSTGGAISPTTAKAAIQGYLNALEYRDTETIARNTLCGIYDAVRDRRQDQALAKLSSDAFRRQFSDAQVTSIDKIVFWSNYQAQVLFTMHVTPTRGGPTRDQVQGMAQLLSQHNRVLVCSYVLRTAGTY